MPHKNKENALKSFNSLVSLPFSLFSDEWCFFICYQEYRVSPWLTKALLCAWLISSQWPRVKGNVPILTGQRCVSGDSPLPLRTKWSPETLWPASVSLQSFKKKPSKGLNNKCIHRRLRMDLLYRRLNWTSWGSEFGYIKKQKMSSSS